MPFVPDTKTSGFVPDSKQKKKGIFGRVWESTKESAKKRFESVKDTFSEATSGNLNPLETGLQTIGSAAGFVGDVAGSALMEGVKAVTPDEVERKVGEKVTTAIQESDIPKLMENYESWKKAHPRSAKDLESVFNIASLLPPIKGGQLASQFGRKTATAAAETATKTAAKVTKAAQKVAPAVETGVKAGVEQATRAKDFLKRGAINIAEQTSQKAKLADLSPVEKEVSRLGVAENLVERVKTAVPESKPAMSKMVEKAKDSITNVKSKARPIEVVGEKLVNSASFLSKKLKETGTALGEIKNTLRGKMVDIPKIRQTLLDDLDKLGIEIDETGKLFSDVPVPDDVMEVLSDIQKFIGWKKKTVGQIDAINLDRLRSYLFRSYTKTGVPLQNQAQGLVSKYRNELLKTLDGVDEGYGALARQYAEQRGALEEFTKLLQYKGDIEDISEKALRAGEVAFRVLGNASDRPRSVIDLLLETASKAGYKQGEDIYDLIDFADELEDILGPQTRSLSGQLERAGTNLFSKIPVLGEAAQKVAEAGAPTVKEQLEALSRLIKEFGK